MQKTTLEDLAVELLVGTNSFIWTDILDVGKSFADFRAVVKCNMDLKLTSVDVSND